MRLDAQGTARIDAVAGLPGGDSVIAGTFSGGLALGEFHLESAGNTDIFIATVDASGKPTWAERLGGAGADFARDVTVSDTTIAVAGAFSGTVDVAGTSLTAPGEIAGLIVLVDRHSHALSARTTLASDYAAFNAVAFLGARLVATGYFAGTLAADDHELVSIGASDIFALAYREDGSVVWARSGGGPGSDIGLAITANNNNILISGIVSTRSRLGRISLRERGTGGFVAALSATGEVAWATQLPTERLGSFTDVAITDGAVFAAGRISGSVTIADKAITTAGATDGAIIAFTPGGDPAWIQTVSGPGRDTIVAIDESPGGTITVVAEIEGPATVFGKPLSESNDRDIVIAQLAGSGDLLWHKVIGGLGADRATDIAALPDGGTLVSGHAPTYGGPFLLRLTMR